MKNIKKFIKKNKMTVVVVICCLILTILIFALKLTFFPNEAKAIYGDRLEGLTESRIKNSDLEQIESNLKEKDGVEKVTTAFSGRILNVIITVKEDMTVDNVKSFPDEVDKALDELNRAKGSIRTSLAKKMDIYKVPELIFIKDDTLDKYERIEEILKEIKKN